MTTPCKLVSRVRLGLLLLVIITISGIVAKARQEPASDDALLQTGTEWPLRGGDAGQTQYSTLNQINKDSVKDLGAVWISQKFLDGATSRVTPVVKDGTMYYTAGSRVYAVDPASGKPAWTFQTAVVSGPLRVGAGAGEGLGVPNSQGIALGGDYVFVGLMNCRVIALNAKTGKLVWDKVLNDYLPRTRQGIVATPTYANGVVFWSITNNERFIGRAIALDATDGHELWHFDTIPGPGEPGHETWSPTNDSWKMGGGNIWLPPAVDPDLGLVFYGTGNADPVHGGEKRPGNNLYTCSLVALDIKTGELRWYYQLTHHDLWENDLGTPPVLYDLEIGGRVRKGVAALRKDGFLFLLDRETGKPIVPVHEQRVEQNAVSKTSPTQPFPEGEGLLPDCRTYWKDRLPAGFELTCWYTPQSLDKLNLLQPDIGVTYEPISFSPQTGYFYEQGRNLLESNRRSEDPYFTDMSSLSITSSRAPGVNKDATSELVALDARTNRVVWRKSEPLPAGNRGTGGWLTTAGGLAFHRMLDGNLEAFDAKTGDLLWRFQTGVGRTGDGTPMTYEIAGKQYIAVTEGTSVWAFALGGTLPQSSPPPPPPPYQEVAGPVQDGDTIRTASLITDTFGDRWRVEEWAFDPYRLRVAAGTPVTFVNNGDQTHTIEALDGSWTTGPLQPNDQVQLTFDKPGTFLIHRKEAPWSYGQIIVTEKKAPSAAATGSIAAAPASSFAGQVDAGKAAYMQTCATCHMANLGGMEAAPSLAGDDFLSRWQGRTAGDLFDKSRTTMPPTAPGSLSREAYLSITAYILQANEYRIGPQALAENALRGMSMVKK